MANIKKSKELRERSLRARKNLAKSKKAKLINKAVGNSVLTKIKSIKRPTRNPHFGAARNRKNFAQAYKLISNSPNVVYHTTAGKRFTAAARITTRGRHKDEPVIVFISNNRERSRSYACCWGFRTNCNRTYIDCYTSVI